ncbi:KptA family-domain-containing protein [Amylocarpus encephaloides]|uniref:2'-phosphotransferase n=1 Tax=Amylocarpus encephaloides TaxID=45428 RepID=A0A9P7YIK6_9HELO|nr:KptA family-domain-containing protein [Amylocarpus encephaloides]
MEVSKALSKLLRHAAEEVGIKLDEQGFAPLDQVMDWPRLKSLQIAFPDILTAVNNNAKNRFSMKANPKLKTPPASDSTDPSDWVIRANQGHSIAVESASILSPITIELNNIPELVVHGTYFAFYQSILDAGGLKKMSRTHIHCSTGLPEGKQGVISGMRGDAELLIYIDVRKSLEDGKTPWWISENGVVLTEGDEDGLLNPKYFKKIIGRKPQECGTLWEDGEKVADLPDPLKNRRAPIGKDRLPKSRAHGKRGGKGSGGRDRGGKAQDSSKAEAEASTSQP